MPRHNRWLALFVATRLIATTAGVTLLVAHTVTQHHQLLALIAVAYGGGTILAAVRWKGLQGNQVAWVVDAAAVLALMLATDSWRSPFYVLGLTALIFPATGLPLRRALAFGGVFTTAYFALAVATGLEWETLRQTSRLESFATHLMVPMITTIALAYGARALRRLQEERNRSERLAVEAERRRIAWELHDSAKQRVHAAHLVLSQYRRSERAGAADPMLDQALAELRAASADIEASLTELRSPLGENGLADGLRKRAAELERLSGVRIEVTGEAPELPAAVGAHTFRVVGEALTNAVRHSGAQLVRVRLDGAGGRLRADVADDGRGLPADVRPGSNGLRSMRARAAMLGGQLEIGARGDGPGTVVTLDVPLDGAPGRETIAPPAGVPATAAR
jgi:signal transduction histidine kinase